MGLQAIELYHQMPSELINEVTYICVLNACSHSGLIDEARSIFRNIQTKTEKIYGTMVYEKDCF
jgi:pentatricopeptide repeat protein